MTRKVDDGSEQWLQEIQQRRMVRGKQALIQEKNSLLVNLPSVDPSQPIRKEFVDIHQQKWHQAPVARNVSGDLSGFKAQLYGGDNFDQVVATIAPHAQRKFFEIIGQQFGAYQQQPPQQMQNSYGMAQPQQTQQPSGICTLREGHMAFIPVQTQGFGTAIPIVKQGGFITENIAMNQFELRQLVNCYIVPPNQNVIDIAKIQSNLTQLVEVRNPQFGVILVPKEAINTNNSQRTVLNDGNNRQLNGRQMLINQQNMQPRQIVQPPNPRQQQMNNSIANFAKKGLLKG